MRQTQDSTTIMAARVQTKPHPPPVPKRQLFFQRSPFLVNLLGLAERQEEEAKHRKTRVLRSHRPTHKKQDSAHKELDLLREEVRRLELRKVSLAGALTAVNTYETAYTQAYRDSRALERQRQFTTTTLRPLPSTQFLPNADPLRMDNRVRLSYWISQLALQLPEMTNEQRSQLLQEQVLEVTRHMKVRSVSAL